MWPFRKKSPVTETIIATREYLTIYSIEGKYTGLTDLHVLIFCVDSQEKKFCKTESTAWQFAKTHNVLISDEAKWKYHGILPEHATRVTAKNNVRKLELVK
jgi:hypothetical protein